MRAYIPVVFAFLTFSSSPYDMVYWIPVKTRAPIAKRAPNAITCLAILITSFWMEVTHHPLGCTLLYDSRAQSVRKLLADCEVVGLASHTAYVGSDRTKRGAMRIQMSEKMRFMEKRY